MAASSPSSEAASTGRAPSHRVGEDAPVTLARHQNGRLTITDPATGWSVELTAFGSDNEAAFAALLPQQ